MNILSKNHRQQGLSLVELMIAMTLGLLLTVGLTTLFVQNRNNFRQNENFAGMQDSARFAMQLISRDLMMAGYWGGVPNGADITIDASANTAANALVAGNDCGPNQAATWAFNTDTPIEFRNHTVATAIGASFGCINNSEYAANTDVLAIRRVAGKPTAEITDPAATTAQLYENGFYLKANNSTGTVIKKTVAGTAHTLNGSLAPANPPLNFWRYIARVYFIQPYADTVGDGIPTLCRYEIDHVASPAMVKTCLAKGVENMQIEWGIDVSGDNNNDILYTSLPNTDGSLANVSTAKITLLVRGTQLDISQTDQKTFNLGDLDTSGLYPTNDNFRRHVYETTVLVRNKPLQP